MNRSDVAASDDLDGLLDALDEADGALRALYRQLAENPDLAGEHEPQLKELHAEWKTAVRSAGLGSGLRTALRRLVSGDVELPP
jgi:hypothetical protein